MDAKQIVDIVLRKLAMNASKPGDGWLMQELMEIAGMRGNSSLGRALRAELLEMVEQGRAEWVRVSRLTFGGRMVAQRGIKFKASASEVDREKLTVRPRANRRKGVARKAAKAKRSARRV